MRSLTVISNGHGEDLIGARLVQALRQLQPALQLQAFPLVGRGRAYEELDLPLLGPRQVLPSGGLTMHSAPLFLADLKAGLLRMTLQQLADLHRTRSDGLLVVGDVYAQLLGMLATARWRFVVQPLISVRHSRQAGMPQLNRLLMERITLPERWLMRRAQAVYTRDEATAHHLRRAGVSSARHLGNPALEDLAVEPLPEFAGQQDLVLLLPGSRSYAAAALQVMLATAALRPDLRYALAWAGDGEPDPSGWEFRRAGRTASAPQLLGSLLRAGQVIPVYTGGFPALLQSAGVALGTAGTAHEQAAACGVPVVGFPLPPAYSAAFLRNQKRLLGRALVIVEARPQLLAAELERLLAPGAARDGAQADGREFSGKAGGSAAIAGDLLRIQSGQCRA
jgi:uncharacterized protein (TIGR03492 family)